MVDDVVYHGGGVGGGVLGYGCLDHLRQFVRRSFDHDRNTRRKRARPTDHPTARLFILSHPSMLASLPLS